MIAKRVVLMAAAILLLGLEFAVAQEDLRVRVDQLYLGWQKEEPKLIWDVLSPEMKEHTEFGKYASNLKKFFRGTKLGEFKVKEEITTVSKTQALVDTDVLILLGLENKKVYAIDTTRWILIGPENTWYFAGTKGTTQVRER